jgi:hypothetical protein
MNAGANEFKYGPLREKGCSLYLLDASYSLLSPECGGCRIRWCEAMLEFSLEPFGIHVIVKSGGVSERRAMEYLEPLRARLVALCGHGFSIVRVV